MTGNGEKGSTMRIHMRGFTLVELMVTTLIIAVLSAIVYPTYKEHINKARRAEAAAALMDGAQRLERYYSTHGSYLDGEDLAAVFTTSIPTSGSAYYTIAAAAATANTFTLQANRVDGGLMSGDKCGDLQIDQAGAHRAINHTFGSDQAAVDYCWRR